MKENVVITIKNHHLPGMFDIEVPIDVPAGQLAMDIAEVFNSYLEKTIFKDAVYYLRCERLNRLLDEKETFYDAGIWNGDVIEMTRKEI